jgi:branched-chain amino acid transport system permease protein
MRFVFKTQYEQDIGLVKHRGQLFWYGLLLLLLLVAPLFLDRFYLGEMSFVFIYAIAGLGLMLLTGFTGQVSLGHAAFLAIGAYAHAYMLSKGLPFLVALPTAMVLTGIVGVIVAIPALRLVGIYLAIATLAFLIIVEQIITRWVSVTGGGRGMLVAPVEIFGVAVATPGRFFYLCLALLIVALLFVMNILRAPSGRAMIAVRDSEIAARSMGINLAKTKATAFGVSAALTGLAGALMAHHTGYISPEAFTLTISIQLLLLIVVGGLGSIHGAILGAIFVGFLPQGIALLRDTLPPAISEIPGLEPGVFGLILILFLLFEPHGIYGQWLKIRQFFSEFPLYRRATNKRQKTYLRTERVR